jgi:single-stranded-DNA-specific exonuclease
MAEALRACGEHLLSFGGHAMAGGLKIARDRIEPFREAFGQYACENVDEEQLRPSLRIDADTTLGAMGYAVVHQLSRLEPYGQNNPRPLVLLRNCTVINPPKRIGRRGRAVSMTLGQNGTSLRAVGFGMGDLADAMVGVRRVDVVAEPSLNEFRGRTSVELHLRDVRWE